MPNSPAADVHIGPAGWSYEDWKGIVYPEKKPRGFEPLPYVARFFNAVEINSSFYHIPAPKTTEKWARLIEPFEDFLFTAKLWQEFTHVRDPIDGQALREWHQAMAPLRRDGRLGAVLLQFPWSFKRAPETMRYLGALTEALEPGPLVIEVRHDSWLDEEYFAWLRARQIAFCNIDQPAMGHCIPPTEHVTAPVAYVRLHGRNYRDWFRDEADVAERYRYLYSKDEISEWVGRLRKVIEKAEKVFVIGNNHTEGRAFANGLQIKSMLAGEKVDSPPELPHVYPELAEFVKPAEPVPAPAQTPDGPEQLSLF
jgi:uncharacterized protein YecE (DUF72 family)